MKQKYYTSQLYVVPFASQTQTELATVLRLDQYTAQDSELIWSHHPEKEKLNIKAVRQLQAKLGFSATGDKKRVVILPHLHTSSIPAQNALLKILEEPPAQTQIIATTHQLAAVLPTIRSRCKIIKANSDPDQAQQQEEATETYHQIKNNSYSQLIALATENKDRDQAKQLVYQLLLSLHQEIDTINLPAQKQCLSDLHSLERSYKLLEANCNPQLVLENCFFELKGS